jgi:hypothetical protein
MRIRIVNTLDGGEITAEMEPGDSAGDVIVFAAQYWKKDRSAFIMRVGYRLIPESATLSEAGVTDGDPVELVPDPQGG